MSNIGGPVSPTEQLTFELDRLLRVSEEAAGLPPDDAQRPAAAAAALRVASPSPSADSHCFPACVDHIVAVDDAPCAPSPAAAVPVPSAQVVYSAMLQAATHNNWTAVGALSSAFAAVVSPNGNNTATTPQQQQHQQQLRAAKHALVELAQQEFELAFASKDIRRREVALRIVAHLFAATSSAQRRPLVSEKVVVGALYRALGAPASSSGDTEPNAAAPHHHHPRGGLLPSAPPLHALLSVARALAVCSPSFADVGLQHLAVFVGKLCTGLIAVTPSAAQHEELCDAIRAQSAVLHGFHPQQRL